MSLCRFKDALGTPRQGSHKTRIPILDIALNDVLLTAILALVTAKFDIKVWPYHFLFWFILAEMLHVLFCVQTKVITTLFG